MKRLIFTLSISAFLLSACSGGQQPQQETSVPDSEAAEVKQEVQSTTFTVNIIPRPIGDPVDVDITYGDGQKYVKDSVSLTYTAPETKLEIYLSQDNAGSDPFTTRETIPMSDIEHDPTTMEITPSAMLDVIIKVEDPGNPGHYTQVGSKKGGLAEADKPKEEDTENEK